MVISFTVNCQQNRWLFCTLWKMDEMHSINKHWLKGRINVGFSKVLGCWTLISMDYMDIWIWIEWKICNATWFVMYHWIVETLESVESTFSQYLFSTQLPFSAQKKVSLLKSRNSPLSVSLLLGIFWTLHVLSLLFIGVKALPPGETWWREEI